MRIPLRIEVFYCALNIQNHSVKMVRTYKKKLGARAYKNYSEEDLKKAVCEVKSGRLSQKAAAEKYKINRTTLLYKVRGSHENNPGHPTVLSKVEEELIAETLGTVSDWGFPMTKSDVRGVIEKFVNKQGRVVPQWKIMCRVLTL